MYTTCLFCNRDLGANTVLPSFPVGRRLAFDAERGRLWVVCTTCDRWNLTPAEERWEAIEECERLFRATRLRYSTGNVGLAQLRDGLELVRVGRALRPEMAAWRYGRFLRRWLPPDRGHPFGQAAIAVADVAARLGGRMAAGVARLAHRATLGSDASAWRRLAGQGGRVVDVVDAGSARQVVRYRHLASAELVRPASHEPWRLVVQHDTGIATLSGLTGLRTAGKLLAGMNGVGVTRDLIDAAVHKLEDAGNPDGYFNRVVGIALRTSWGRHPFVPDGLPASAYAPSAGSDAERLALYLTGRSFWGRGAIGSAPSTHIARLPLVDRLALEMAANEDTERRALEGELAELEAAWRDAEEIAAIADTLLDERASPDSARGFRGLPAFG
jgi:hypothetical protein